MDHILQPVLKQLEAYNRRDIDAFMVNFSKDCIIEDGEGNIIERGKYFIQVMYADLFERSPNLHCELKSRIVKDNYVIDEERVTGRAGSEDEVHAVVIYRVKDGLIEHVRFL